MSNGINPRDGIKEMKVLEFTVGGKSYGLNLFDVREILPYSEPTLIPNSHPNIEGFFMPRDFLITIISMAKCLEISENPVTKEDRVILAGIEDQNIAFHVENVAGIHKIADTDIIEPDEEITTTLKDAIIGILDIGIRQIIILDIKVIVNSIKLIIEI